MPNSKHLRAPSKTANSLPSVSILRIKIDFMVLLDLTKLSIVIIGTSVSTYKFSIEIPSTSLFIFAQLEFKSGKIRLELGMCLHT